MANIVLQPSHLLAVLSAKSLVPAAFSPAIDTPAGKKSQGIKMLGGRRGQFAAGAHPRFSTL